MRKKPQQISGWSPAPCEFCEIETCPMRWSDQTGVPMAKPEMWTMRRGEQLHSGPRNGHDIWVVRQGTIMLQFVLADGRRQVLAFRFEGEIACALVADGVSNRGIVALTSSSLCCIPHERLVGMNGNDGAHFYRKLLGLACHQMLDGNIHAVVLGRLIASERVAAFLIEMARRQRLALMPGAGICLPMRRDDIADYLALKSETVSRILNGFARDGLISLPDRGSAVVLDAERLRSAMALAMDGARSRLAG